MSEERTYTIDGKEYIISELPLDVRNTNSSNYLIKSS